MDGPTIQTSVALPAAVRHEAERLAAAERRSLSNFLATIVEDRVGSDLRREPPERAA
jgi:hypothetical protein